MVWMPTLKRVCTEILNTKAQRIYFPRRRVVHEVQDCGIPERGDARLVFMFCELPRSVLWDIWQLVVTITDPSAEEPARVASTALTIVF